MIHKIVKEPAAVLRAKARPLEPNELNTPQLHKLVKEMVHTMYDAKGVGLAAPQIGIGKQIIIVAPPEAEPLAVINPVISKQSIGGYQSEEGCLSVPGIWGFVRRANSLTVSGLTPEGKVFKKKCIGFEATIFQHECDHLNGVLFIDKAKNLTKLGVNLAI
jgi:peptide deformylase